MKLITIHFIEKKVSKLDQHLSLTPNLNISREIGLTEQMRKGHIIHLLPSCKRNDIFC